MNWRPETLLAETAWMHALARRLVADGAAAEDLVQDAWVLALRRDEPPSRAWMQGALRKLSFTRRRAEARRGERERRAARPEREPDPSETLARVEAQRLLVETLLSLDEPHRSTLAWRYCEGMNPREIAAHGGLPIGTVHSRLNRGLEQLRAELQRRRGKGDGGWLAALAPLVSLREAAAPAAAAWIGGSIGAVALIAIALVAVFFRNPGNSALSNRAELGAAAPTGATDAAPRPAVVIAAADAPRERVALVGADSEPTPPDEPQLARWSLALSVVDSAERPVPDVDVSIVTYCADERSPHALGRTDRDGRLENALEVLNAFGWATWSSGWASLVLSHPAFPVTRHELDFTELTGPEHLDVQVSLGSGPRLFGRVLGTDGAPVSGAEVRKRGDDGKQLEFALSGADGRFCFHPAEGRRGFVEASADGLWTRTDELDLAPGNVGDLRLEALATLRGRVVDRDGRPVAAAELQVRLRASDADARAGRDWGQTATDADGRFAFPGLRYATYALECSPTPVEPRGELLVDLPAADLELRVDGPRLLIRTRDGGGRPEVGVWVLVTPVEGPWEQPPERESTWTWPPAGLVAFPVVAGATYALSVEGRGGRAREQLVRVPEDAAEHEVVLVTGAEPRECELIVRALDPDGQPVPVEDVSLRSEIARDWLDDYGEMEPDAAGRITHLPAGRFRVSVNISARETRDRRIFLPRVDRLVELTPERPAELVCQLERGGVLTLRVDAMERPEGVPAPLEPEDEGYLEHLQRYGVLPVFVTGEPDDPSTDPLRLGTRAVMRVYPGPDRRGLVRRWLPGESGTHWNVEPPGRYLLRITGEGWETFEREVELRAGEETTVNALLMVR